MKSLENPCFPSATLKKFENAAKLRLRDGLVWTLGITVEIKLPFQIRLDWALICLMVDLSIPHCIRSLFI